jgi:pilus assembly protein CpaF
MYDTIFDLADEREVPAIHPIISASNTRENVHAIA